MNKNAPVSLDKIQQALERVTRSELFSEKNQQLLTYLVRKSLDHDPPKEATIAVEHFQADLSKEEDTSFVRVAVYHLRKRLKEYYLTEGKNDDLLLDIEKGSYEVSFKEKEPTETDEAAKNKRLVPGLVVIILLLISALAYAIVFDEAEKSYQQTLIYQDLSSNSKPVLVVLGDLFMYHDTTGNLVRDYNINRQADLESQRPDLLPFNQSRSKYLTRQHAISLYYFSDLLRHLDRSVNFRMASELTIEDLKENNIIFIGYFKSLYLLDAYYNISHYEPSPSYGVLLEKDTRDTIQIVGNPGELHKDYGIFSRVSGIEDTFIYLIAGFTDTSVELISSKVLNQAFLDQVGTENFPDKQLPEYFEILFEVEGYDRKELSTISVVEATEIEGEMWD